MRNIQMLFKIEKIQMKKIKQKKMKWKMKEIEKKKNLIKKRRKI